jgi:2',3'-cyclic-nucleotide 2'-phosphodiesterase (5'-nucleotidase family)
VNRRRAFGALLALWSLGCGGDRNTGPAVAAPSVEAAPGPVELRFLFTSDEHGWVAPVVERGKARGGAAEVLARWKQQEGHCVPAPGESCTGAGTLALSGGDNWTGPALSSYFRGVPAAEVLRRMGYAASALGNHELDFGRETFEQNARAQEIPYLGANVSPALGEGGVTRPYVLVERRGITVGVVGLSTEETPRSGMRDHYKGLTFGKEEDALRRVIPEVYKAGADLVVVIGHVCAAELRPIVARHPEWRLAFVGGGHCHRTSLDQVFATPIVEAGSFLQKYVRISVTVDRRRPERERVLSSRAELVDLSYPEGQAPPVAPDPSLAELIAGWQRKTDEALGEVVGHVEEELPPDSPLLVNFLTDRWREATGADAVILNRFGTRQAIPRGAISLGTIYSVLPFNNNLVTMRLTGAQLTESVRCCGGHVSGVKQGPDGVLRLADGRPVERDARYTVVATDYTYFGGSGFPFEKQDPAASFGEDWRLPLIRWFRAHPTAPGRGLEQFLDREPRLPPARETRR